MFFNDWRVSRLPVIDRIVAARVLLFIATSATFFDRAVGLCDRDARSDACMAAIRVKCSLRSTSCRLASYSALWSR